MEKRLLSYLGWISVLCMVMAESFVTVNAKEINDIGTFCDNSWDGEALKDLSAVEDDSKENLLHDYKVVNGKVKL